MQEGAKSNCRYCHVPIWFDGVKSWIDETNGDGCDNRTRTHQPDPQMATLELKRMPIESDSVRSALDGITRHADNGTTDVFASALIAFDDMLHEEFFERLIEESKIAADSGREGFPSPRTSRDEWLLHLKAAEMGTHVSKVIELVRDFQELVRDAEGS